MTLQIVPYTDTSVPRAAGHFSFLEKVEVEAQDKLSVVVSPVNKRILLLSKARERGVRGGHRLHTGRQRAENWKSLLRPRRGRSTIIRLPIGKIEVIKGCKDNRSQTPSVPEYPIFARSCQKRWRLAH